MGVVAHFGTFDVEHFGNLLLPLILERRLGDLGHAFLHVAPLGGLPVWVDAVPTVRCDTFVESPPPDLAAIVVGGGNIIHASPATLPRYDQGGTSAILAYPRLWLGAAIIAAQANLPYVWNAPGAAQPFSPAGSRLVEWAASGTDYLAVRDHLSRARLRDAGVMQPIRIVPDTALETARLWSPAELDEAFRDAFAARGRQVPERVIVLHLDQRDIDEPPASLAARLDRIAQRLQATPVLIAMGPCHGDDRVQREVGASMASDPLVIDHPRSLREVVACLSRAQAYLGSSLHGMIVACSFGIPGMGIISRDAGARDTFLGFLEPLQLDRWIAASWEAVESRLDEFATAPREPWARVLDATMPALDEHWRLLRSALPSSAASPEHAICQRNTQAALERLAYLSAHPDPHAALYAPLVAEQAARVIQMQHAASAARQAAKAALAERDRQLADIQTEVTRAQEAATRERRGKDDALAELSRLRSRNAILETELDALRTSAAVEHTTAQQALADRERLHAELTSARKDAHALRGRLLLEIDEISTSVNVAARQAGLIGIVLERASGRMSSHGKPGKVASELAIAQEELARLRGTLGALLDAVQLVSLPEANHPVANPDHERTSQASPHILTPPAAQDAPFPADLAQPPSAASLDPDDQPHAADPGTNREPVDIVICVHNALDDVQRCLGSISRHTSHPYRLIVVDDGSDVATATWVQRFVQQHEHAVLLRNEHPVGYTRAANQGLRVSSSAVVVLLNSDTIVTARWLDHLLACLESDPRIGIVGPLSNAASYQSVPERFDPSGDWARNPLPPGWDIDSIAAAVEHLSPRAFPRVPFVNGFCFAVTRAVLETIGLFDEDRFPDGYGEENDFCLRAADAGFTLAIADQAYVYHAKSRSYSHHRRRELGRAGRAMLISTYGQERLEAGEHILRDDLHLATMRSALAVHLQKARPRPDATGLSVLFLLPVSGGGGGAHSVVQEAMGMRRLGINAQVAICARHRARYRAQYPDISERDDLFFAYRTPDALQSRAAHVSVVVATIYTSMPLLAEITANHPHVLPAYYIQDYEPFFYPEGSPGREAASRSYTLVPDAVLFAKTRWLCETVAALHHVTVHKVSPSLDHAVYYPPDTPRSDGPVRVAAMIRPSSARRGARRTMDVLQRLTGELGGQVDVHLFGASDPDLAAANLPLGFPYRNHGVLTREGVAATLRACDVFLDLSDYQAFGRTGLEAMACGCAVVLPALGGATEYAVHGENALLIDTSNADLCVEAARALVADPDARQRLQEAGLATAARYSIVSAAASEIDLLTRELASRQMRRSASNGRHGKSSEERMIESHSR